MICIKTGCHAYLTEYDEWVYGDAFANAFGHVDADTPGAAQSRILILRIVQRSYTGPVEGMKHKHFTISRSDQWFDQAASVPVCPSTLVARGWTYHGYEGVPNDWTGRG